MAGEAYQVGVGHLTESDESVMRHERIVHIGQVICKEAVIGPTRQCDKDGGRMPNRYGVGRHLRVRRNPDESSLRDGTGAPLVTSERTEPAPRTVVVDVRFPNEGNEHIHIRELDHSSSSALLTMSEVMTVEPAVALMVGTPSTTSTREGRSPDRASEEMIDPIDSLCIRASSRAASITSLSISNVVRTS